MVLVVTYDLRKPGKDNNSLFAAIEKLGGAWKPLLSAWLVETNFSPLQVRDFLLSHMDQSDGLFVAQLVRNWAAHGLDPKGIEWLKGRSF